MTHSPIALWPDQLTLVHHIELPQRTNFADNLRASLIVALGAVALGLILALPAAYAFSRFRFRGRAWLRTQFLVINMFPVVMLILPILVLMLAGRNVRTVTVALQLFSGENQIQWAF